MGPGPDYSPEPTHSGALDAFAAAPSMPPPLLEPGEFWRREPKRRYIILFLLTLVSTTMVGTWASGYPPDVVLGSPTLLVHGLWYSVPVLAILGAHEFGHYFACVYYRVNASLPYFIPLPLPPSGTLGAVIRIRQPLPGKRALFDIGIAGPLAGFVVLVPVLFAGLMMSEVVTIPASLHGRLIEEYGEPLLLKFFAWTIFGPIAEDQVLFLHPLGMAAWWGMLATSLNLFPVGQLDGGHITYAVLGPLSTRISLITLVCLIGLTIFASVSWLVWTVLIVVMMGFIGPRHPRVWDEDVPLDRSRVILAVVALLVFVLCFTPTPIEVQELVGRR